MKNLIKAVIICSFPFFSVQAEEIVFDSNVKFKKNNSTEFVELKAQQPLVIEAGESAFVSTQEGLPFVILSASRSNSTINIPSSQISLMSIEQASSYLEKTANEVVDGIRRVDRLITKRDYSTALNTITKLKEKYNNISSILFLSGTINYLSNNKSVAVKDLEKGLTINPENSSAKKLLEKIKKEL